MNRRLVIYKLDNLKPSQFDRLETHALSILQLRREIIAQIADLVLGGAGGTTYTFDRADLLSRLVATRNSSSTYSAITNSALAGIASNLTYDFNLSIAAVNTAAINKFPSNDSPALRADPHSPPVDVVPTSTKVNSTKPPANSTRATASSPRYPYSPSLLETIGIPYSAFYANIYNQFTIGKPAQSTSSHPSPTRFHLPKLGWFTLLPLTVNDETPLANFQFAGPAFPSSPSYAALHRSYSGWYLFLEYHLSPTSSPLAYSADSLTQISLAATPNPTPNLAPNYTLYIHPSPRSHSSPLPLASYLSSISAYHRLSPLYNIWHSPFQLDDPLSFYRYLPSSSPTLPFSIPNLTAWLDLVSLLTLTNGRYSLVLPNEAISSIGKLAFETGGTIPPISNPPLANNLTTGAAPAPVVANYYLLVLLLFEALGRSGRIFFTSPTNSLLPISPRMHFMHALRWVTRHARSA